MTTAPTESVSTNFIRDLKKSPLCSWYSQVYTERWQKKGTVDSPKKLDGNRSETIDEDINALIECLEKKKWLRLYLYVPRNSHVFQCIRLFCWNETEI